MLKNFILENQIQVTPDHVKAVAKNVLRHRILINFEGQADDITPDDITKELLEKVKIV